ncbi:citrate (Si)-synthase [Brevibacterium sp. HMSC08F02]|uniref:citrate synthase n=1 Tax=unclassified Brevibacterium TaxID=2614124 RepID=UPI0008A33B14|nr:MULTISPECIES: citrate synthase [unclassified Brevibacterium]OFT25237.1 citrate (Si)-synthase [Brevibacterium sp. HMSC08F02]OFT96770.1 citrate (Si)-synthase [Brevibacterium sp. HMSC22B09]
MAADGFLRVDDHELELEGVESTAGTEGLNISKLLAETDRVTFDPGFGNTASSTSAITFIDGDEGILRYRGYAIEDLAENASFVEVAYLLIKGELPTAEQLKSFEERIAQHAEVPQGIYDLVAAMPEDAHPMSILSTAVSALGTFNQDTIDVYDDAQMEEAAVRLLGAMPVLTALAHRRRFGVDSVLRPEPQYGLVGNFFRSNFGVSGEEYASSENVRKALDLLFILHADHEQNCSTSSVRLVGSSEANLYQSVVAGINALAGPLHGGANSAVLEMLEEISQSDDGAESYMERVKNKERGVRLMGFGHRVYKNYDPRAAIIKQTAHDIIEEQGGNDDLLDLATALEKVALDDDYFVSRKLYPNVDFYTGLIYKALGFPTDMFTVIFAMGRLPGWIAQWIEMRGDDTTRIGRPRQIYTGEKLRTYPSN